MIRLTETLQDSLDEIERLHGWWRQCIAAIIAGLVMIVVSFFLPGIALTIIGALVSWVGLIGTEYFVYKGRKTRQLFEVELFSCFKKEYRFIGRDGSMGLKHGNVYDLVVLDGEDAVEYFNLKDKYKECETTVVLPWVIPYDTTAGFEKNWEGVLNGKA